jgi:hypothetical protein
MILTVEMVDQLIAAKRAERDEAMKILRAVEKELAVLKEQRERLLYDGMTKSEFIAYLSANPQEKEFDGFTVIIDGWMMRSTITLEDGTKVTFRTTVYKDDAFEVAVLTKNKRHFTYNNEFPIKYAYLLDKVKDAAFSLKVVERD